MNKLRIDICTHIPFVIMGIWAIALFSHNDDGGSQGAASRPTQQGKPGEEMVGPGGRT